MKFLYTFILTVSSFLLSAQVAKDYAVLLRADIQTSPKGLKLSWNSYASATQYQIYRKQKDSLSWGSVYTTLSGSSTSFTDTALSIFGAWEYRVRRTGGITAEGYVYAGFETQMPVNRGVCILVIDSSVFTATQSRLNRWIKDAEGDGWIVKSIKVSRSSSVSHVKDSILHTYHEDPVSPHSVFLFGHVPVPYSGGFTVPPDGHTDHVSAWPADAFYGDIDGNWTDISVNNSTGSDPRNRNIPGDGKFDQSFFPSTIELSVGRVDFADLPIISTSEIDLLKSYLDRNHAFRIKDFAPRERAVMDDNFGAFSGEAFAASGWKSFAPIVGDTAIEEVDLLTSTRSNSYLWAYGCGGGSYTSCGGVGTSNDFASDSQQAVFMMMFGSYFGDWGATNNLLRTALAKGTALSICWSGRPHWMFHHTGLGEPLGFSTKVSQNNTSLYVANAFQTSVHNSLLGDPTLRIKYLKPASNLTASAVSNHAVINWTASTDIIAGYNVYRSSGGAPFERVNLTPITTTTYTDSCLNSTGIFTYMVRSVALNKSASGTYWNEGTGIMDTCLIIRIPNPSAAFTYATDTPGQFMFTPFSSDAIAYKWLFGDGDSSTLISPTHQYASAGSYTVTLIASTECKSTTRQEIIFSNTGIASISEIQWKMYPNPTEHAVTISGINSELKLRYWISNTLGNTVMKDEIENNAQIDTRGLESGLYTFHLVDKNGVISTKKLIIY